MYIPPDVKSTTGGDMGVSDTVRHVLQAACNSMSSDCDGSCRSCALDTPKNFMAHLKEVKESGDG